MRRALLTASLFVSILAGAQVHNWDPQPYRGDGGIKFHDDLDFYLNGYSKEQIRDMRHQVSMWRMNFDKMIRATVRDIQAYSEGGNMVAKTHDFSLLDIRAGRNYKLKEHDGKLRAFMFASLTNPPARMQLPYLDRLRTKYDTAQVELFVIYGKELHPGDKKKFRAYPLPKDMDQKRGYARELSAMTELPVLVDGMDDAVLKAYGSVPNGAYVIDRDGRLIFRGTWADGRKIEQILDTVLKWEGEGKPRLPAQP